MKALKITALIIGVGVLACVALAVLSSLGRSAQPGQSGAPVTNVVSNSTQALELPTAVPEPTVVPASTIGKVGERREAGGVALTAMKVEKAKEIGTFQKAKEGKMYLLVEVLLETTGRDEAPYNPIYFKVKDADGFEYNVTISTADNTLKSGKLTAGEKVRGVVTFEVPEQASGLVLSYEPIVLLGGYEPIRIALD